MTLMDTSSLTFSKHEDLSFLVQTLHLCKSKLLDLHSLWISYTINKAESLTNTKFYEKSSRLR